MKFFELSHSDKAWLWICALFFSFLGSLRITIWGDVEHDTGAFWVAIACIGIFFVASRRIRYHHFLRCLICTRDLAEGDGLKNGVPYIPAIRKSKVVGSLCATCFKKQKSQLQKPEDESDV